MIDRLSQQDLFCILGRESWGRPESRGRLLGAWSREGTLNVGQGGWSLGVLGRGSRESLLTRGVLGGQQNCH